MGNLTRKVETELFKGRTHQELFNEIAEQTDYDIHEIAEGLRKIPGPAKRVKYQALNRTLAFLFVANIATVLYISLVSKINMITVGSMIVQPLLIYGILKFRRDVHMISGGLLLLGAVMGMFSLTSDFTILALCDLLVTLSASGIAFYLGMKLTTDYCLNREELKENPDLRAGAVTFFD
jgi:hypothetical protein